MKGVWLHLVFMQKQYTYRFNWKSLIENCKIGSQKYSAILHLETSLNYFAIHLGTF